MAELGWRVTEVSETSDGLWVASAHYFDIASPLIAGIRGVTVPTFCYFGKGETEQAARDAAMAACSADTEWPLVLGQDKA